ncbi:MAG: dihydroorotase [Clostridia bacterium]|nr:dihydroorotase [Clostridia bacterium]
MALVINNATTIRGRKINLKTSGGKNAYVGKSSCRINRADTVIDAKGLTLLPGLIDMHVHLREPGYEYKEDIASGSAAAVAGGFSAVCCMPNTNPVTDNKYIVKYITARAKEVNLAKVYPIASITVGLEGKELTKMNALKEAGAVAFSDDGAPVSDSRMMRNALEYASTFGYTVIEHCEDKSLVAGGVVNEGAVATRLGLPGITRAAEEVEIARNLVLAETLGCRIHIAHVSTEGGVQLIREAKKRGVAVTCETCPHYFALTDEVLEGYDTAAKVNPPIREDRDRLAIIRGIQDGTIDCIVTDHAPHSAADKALGFMDAPSGISGLESSFAVSYSVLVAGGHITMQRLAELMTYNPAKILGIKCGKIERGGLADFTLVDLKEEYAINPSQFVSKGKNSPFAGYRVKGAIKYTVVDGSIKYAAR